MYILLISSKANVITAKLYLTGPSWLGSSRLIKTLWLDRNGFKEGFNTIIDPIEDPHLHAWPRNFEILRNEVVLKYWRIISKSSNMFSNSTTKRIQEHAEKCQVIVRHSLPTLLSCLLIKDLNFSVNLNRLLRTEFCGILKCWPQ